MGRLGGDAADQQQGGKERFEQMGFHDEVL
jgi:hypothetical protein